MPCQFIIRPSAFVRALKGAEGPSGRKRVSDTARRGAGRPVTRSRTWQVMGSLGGAVGAAMGETACWLMLLVVSISRNG